MEEKKLLEGKYLMYKDKPLVREGDTICYGDMTDDYILFMMILKNKTVVGANGAKSEVPEKVLVQILSTDTQKKPIDRIAKQTEKGSLYEAMDIGLIWLDKMNKN